MIRIYSGTRSGALPLFILAGIILLFAVVIWGFTKAIEILLPLLVLAADALIVIFVLGLLPLGLIKEQRLKIGALSLGMSHILGAVTWMVSLFYVVKIFGFLGIVLAFLLQLLAPIALAGAVLKGSWSIARDLSVWILFIYAMRFYSQWLMSFQPRRPAEKDIIDVEAQEVEDEHA